MSDDDGCISEKLIHADIAGYIGCSREMVSLLMKELKTGKFVSYSRGGYYKVLKTLPENY